MAFWKPAENPRTRPLRSWAFDIGCAIVAGAASLARFSFGQAEHSGHLPLAAGLIVAALTAKLGLRDRVQAVVLAYESTLIIPGATPPNRPGNPN